MITWDRSGEVKIRGVTIPNSNISDLVSDAMRSRKDFNPTGANQFFQVLSEINVPKDLVRNKQRWKQLETSSIPPRRSAGFAWPLERAGESATSSRAGRANALPSSENTAGLRVLRAGRLGMLPSPSAYRSSPGGRQRGEQWLNY